MREMSAMRKVHRQDPVSRLQNAKINGHVRLAPAMRLDVHVFRAKKFFSPINRQLLNDVDIFASTVPSPAGISFGVFVRETRTLSRHNRATREIFGRD